MKTPQELLKELVGRDINGHLPMEIPRNSICTFNTTNPDDSALMERLRHLSWEDLPLLAANPVAMCDAPGRRDCHECTEAAIARILLREHQP